MADNFNPKNDKRNKKYFLGIFFHFSREDGGQNICQVLKLHMVYIISVNNFFVLPHFSSSY